MTDLEKTIEFLKEYTKVCKKYVKYIGACGCCESPCVVDAKAIEHLIRSLSGLEVDAFRRDLMLLSGITEEHKQNLYQEIKSKLEE